MTVEKTFALENGQVLHNRGLAGEAKVMLDLTGARSKPFLALLRLNEIENVLLPISQHASWLSSRPGRASSNEQISVLDRQSKISLFKQLLPASQIGKPMICVLDLWKTFPRIVN